MLNLFSGIAKFPQILSPTSFNLLISVNFPGYHRCVDPLFTKLKWNAFALWAYTQCMIPVCMIPQRQSQKFRQDRRSPGKMQNVNTDTCKKKINRKQRFNV